MNSLLAQGTGAKSPARKGRRSLRSPWGRDIDAVVFVRSYQEKEKSRYKTVAAALEAENSKWFARELVILPSHLDEEDVRQMIVAGHEYGFDVVAASVLLNDKERKRYRGCWTEGWDERWNIPNPTVEKDWEGQVDALGRDLWTWICRAMQG